MHLNTTQGIQKVPPVGMGNICAILRDSVGTGNIKYNLSINHFTQGDLGSNHHLAMEIQWGASRGWKTHSLNISYGLKTQQNHSVLEAI